MNPSSEIPIRMQGTRRDQSCFGFLSIRNQALWDYADVGCKSAHYERHESCSQQKFFEVFDGQQISQTTFVLDFGSKGANNSRSKKFALCRCQRTAEGEMEGEKRERWMRLCVEAAVGQDSNRLLELISEIDRLLREKEMRLRNVRREARRYVIEAAEKKAS